MVGFNRRFAPLLTQMRSQFGPASSSAVTRYLVNAGPLAADSWYRNDALEGSRFTGEGGHFIDTLSWWAGSLPEEVYAVPGPENDDVQVTVRFQNGSSGVISYVTGRQHALPEGDVRRRRWRPERTARQLQEGYGLGRTAAEHHAGARRPGQGPASRTRPVRRGLPDRRRRCRSRSRTLVAVTRATIAVRESLSSRTSGARMSTTGPHGSAGTPAGPPRCRQPRWRGERAIRCCGRLWSRRQVTPGQARHGCAAARGRAPDSPPSCRRTPPRASPRRPGRPFSTARTGCWAASGKCWASTRTDLVLPDWFRDPVTGRRSAPDRYAFRIDHRSEEQVGNVKQVWELSRLQHLTLLATPGFSPVTSNTPAGSPTICAPGGGRIPSCPACTGRAASSSASA